MSVRDRLVPILLLLSATVTLWANTEFSGLDLSSDNRLLFSAQTGGDGAPRQDALFLAYPEKGTLRQLTAYPERVEILDSGRLIQIRNPFGILRVPSSGGLPKSVPGFPSFSEGATVRPGRIEDMVASPDGRWLLTIEPTSAAYGRLVLIDTIAGARATIAEGVERPGTIFPASWSPDSKIFVYNRARRLYFRPVGSDVNAVVDERYRLIGEGSMRSIRWGLETSDFFYFKGTTVYRVRSSELFARSLYAEFLQIGAVVGSVPVQFDPNFDAFWISPDASAIILAKAGKNLFYYSLTTRVAGGASSLPYLVLDAEKSRLSILWSAAGIATVLAESPGSDGPRTRAFRLVPPVDGPTEEAGGIKTLEQWRFEELPIPALDFAQLSPDGTRMVVGGKAGTIVYDYVNWRVITALSKTPSLAALWIGNESLVLADKSMVTRVTLDGKSSLICLASVESYGFETEGSRILANVGGVTYGTDGNSAWTLADGALRDTPKTASKQYRVYLDELQRGPYSNAIMVRNLQGTGTSSLLVRAPDAFESLVPTQSAQDAANQDGIFSHGMRYGRREVSLVFDMVDEGEGLSFVLDVLEHYGIRSTFFLNGEFIRRHPMEAKRIADLGMEVASMFFAPIDLTDVRYRIDGDFIKRGLARNEDEFYNATERELSLLWHAPYYAVTSAHVEAAAKAGYRYVGRDVDPLDWVSSADARKMPGLYKPAADLVDAVVAAKKPGSIIPIRLGLPTDGDRDDYLFDKVDVLVDALIQAGYRVVPVSTLMEHAR